MKNSLQFAKSQACVTTVVACRTTATACRRRADRVPVYRVPSCRVPTCHDPAYRVPVHGDQFQELLSAIECSLRAPIEHGLGGSNIVDCIVQSPALLRAGDPPALPTNLI